MEQSFADRLAKTNTKDELLKLLNELDEDKRALKASLRKFSNESFGEGGLAGKERFRKIRKMKSKLSHLIEDRESVRVKLGKIKEDKNALNRAANQRNIEFCHAFIAAAERILPEEQFLEIELRALDILNK